MMIYNEITKTNKIPITFSDFDGVHKQINIKKFIVELGQPSLNFSLNVDFLINKNFSDNFLLDAYPIFIPAPFEKTRYSFNYKFPVFKNCGIPHQVFLYSDFIHHNDFIIILDLTIAILDQNSFRIIYNDFEVHSIPTNITKINLFRQMLEQDFNLMQEYTLGNRRLKFENDPDLENYRKMFTIDSMEVIINNKYIEQITDSFWTNMTKKSLTLPMTLSNIFYIFARNCERNTKTINKFYNNETSLIGFILYDLQKTSNLYEVKAGELADFTVDYNSFIEILDENNEYVNLNKIILFYELIKPN